MRVCVLTVPQHDLSVTNLAKVVDRTLVTPEEITDTHFRYRCDCRLESHRQCFWADIGVGRRYAE